MNSPWIISRNQDLGFFYGGALVGYLIIGLLALGASIWPFYYLMLFILEGPHVFATATRTYFDPVERKRLGPILWLLIPFCLVGPAFYAIGLGALFVMLAFTWLHFHVAKQHLGFAMLYRRKAGEVAGAALDRSFLISSLMLPVAGFWIGSVWPSSSSMTWRLLLVTYSGFLLVFLAAQLRRPANWPKLALMALIVPLQWLAFWYAPQTAYGIAAAGVPVSIGHTLQYHRLVWFHNQNRLGSGFAAMVNRRLIYFAAVCIGLNLLLNVSPRWVLAGMTAVVSAVWGLSFTHFFLDGRIWRIRGDRELAAALSM